MASTMIVDQPKLYRRPLVFGEALTSTACLNFAGLAPGTETTGSIVSTGTAWVDHSALGSCAMKLLCSYSGASGDYATLRMRARSDAASGSANGVVCGNFSASAGINNHANLYALQGYAQPNAYTQSGGAHIACGVYSCIDATAASSGRRWSLWTDDHSTTKASGGHFLHRLSYNPQSSGAGIDGVWTVYAPQTGYLLNFEYNSAGSPFVTGSTALTSVCIGTIAVRDAVAGVTGYINVYSS
jgi:hypothetical protein